MTPKKYPKLPKNQVIDKNLIKYWCLNCDQFFYRDSRDFGDKIEALKTPKCPNCKSHLLKLSDTNDGKNNPQK